MPTNYIDKIITTDNTEYVISVDLNNVQNADDLKAIEGISGTSGLLKKTASNTWTLDTSNYITSADVPEGASAYTGPISAVGTSSSSGSDNGFARGDHVHNITKATVDTVLGTGSGTEKFYREDGTWADPPGGEYEIEVEEQSATGSAAVGSATTAEPNYTPSGDITMSTTPVSISSVKSASINYWYNNYKLYIYGITTNSSSQSFNVPTEASFIGSGVKLALKEVE